MMTSTKNKISRRYRVIAASVILLAASAIIIATGRNTMSRSYISDLENPFFDVFTLYFYDEKDEAKQRLLQLMEKDTYRTHAFINYGIIQEREENYTEAEAYYRKALKDGDHGALLYLYSVINAFTPANLLPLLDSLTDIDSSHTYWIEYEKAAHYMKVQNKEQALVHLEKAVQSGFYSASLITADPAFNAVRENPRYQSLLREIGNNRSNFRSLKHALEKAEEKLFVKLPYGLAKELKPYLDLNGRRFPAAEEQLTSLLRTDLQFRDRCVVLYWLAGMRAKKGDFNGARTYLTQFTAMIQSENTDRTGFKKVVRTYQKDILHNGPILKKIAN